MRSLRIEFRFKNAILYDALCDRFLSAAKILHKEKPGIVSPIPIAAQVIGIGASHLRQLLSMTVSPYRHNRQGPTITAQKIAEFLEQSVEQLFPVDLYAIRWPRLSAMNVEPELLLPLEAARNVTIAGPDQDIRLQIEEALHRLKVREEKVLRLRFGFEGPEETLEEIGDRLGVTRERVRMIEASGLRKLRSQKLLDTHR